MKKNFQKYLLQKTCFLVFVFCAFIPTTRAISVYSLGEEIISYEYNKDWSRWFKRTLQIWVGADPLERSIIFLYFTSQAGDIVIDLGSSLDKQAELRKSFTIAVNWSKTAKLSKANSNRVLGCYGKAVSTICTQTGIANQRGELGLRFFSRENGSNIQIIFNLIDKDKLNHKADLYFNPGEIEQLLKLLENIK